MVPDIADGKSNAWQQNGSVQQGSWFATPRQDQSTAPRRAAHLEHTNTPRAPFFSVRAAVRNIFS